ncbi:hypothetical protein FACS18948_3170 [Clostridia bacterium]|nr:hypothetical protein FACS18948_3170 [Clostridia bacterium]
MVIPKNCACDEARKAAERKRTELQAEHERIARLRKKSLLSDSMSRHVFRCWDARTEPEKRILAICVRYVERFAELLRNGQGLLLWGPPGTGKTFAAGCIANALLESGNTVATTSVSDLMILRGKESEEGFVGLIGNVRLMVLDDLGAERSSDYGKERLYSAIDTRYRSGKPLIVTTNLSLPQMIERKDIADARIYDRILEKCYPVSFEGLPERRKIGAVDNFKAAKLLLEG